MLRILHTADIHAGRPSPKELDRERSTERRREVDRSVFRLIDFAHSEKAGIILIAGDFFEHLHQRPAWAREVSDLFRSVPHIKVFISPGNHDPLLPDSLYRSIDWPPNVTIFSGPGFREVSLDDLGVSIYGMGWTSFSERERLLRGLKPRLRGNWRNIAVLHGDLQQDAKSQSIYLPVHPDDISQSGMDYIALGHIHAPSSGKAGDTVYAYSGCPEPLDIKDVGDRGVFLVSLGEGRFGSRVEASFVPMATRRVQNIQLDITGLDTEERVRNAVLECCEDSVRKKDIFTIELTGIVDPSFNIDLQVLEREMTKEFYSVRLVPAYTPDYDMEALLSPDNASLEARFARHLLGSAKDLQARGDDRGARIASLAAYYGLDALRQGRVLKRRRGN